MLHLKLRFLSGSLLLAAVIGLTGCGTSEKSVVPVVTNPFAGVTVGTDSILEIATWNLEHFAKKGDATVNAVIQAVQGMDVDTRPILEARQ